MPRTTPGEITWADAGSGKLGVGVKTVVAVGAPWFEVATISSMKPAPPPPTSMSNTEKLTLPTPPAWLKSSVMSTPCQESEGFAGSSRSKPVEVIASEFSIGESPPVLLVLIAGVPLVRSERTLESTLPVVPLNVYPWTVTVTVPVPVLTGPVVKDVAAEPVSVMPPLSQSRISAASACSQDDSSAEENASGVSTRPVVASSLQSPPSPEDPVRFSLAATSAPVSSASRAANARPSTVAATSQP